MKRTVIWLCAILVVLVTGIGVIAAETRGWHGWRGHRFAGFGPAAYVVYKLDLNTSQRQAIKSIWQVERPTVARLVHELAAESRELNTARAEGKLDDATVQGIVSRQGATIAKLALEKERLVAKIYSSVLDPEQRKRADELQQRWQEKLDHIANRLEE